MQHLADMATNAKIAVVVSAATTSTGLGYAIEVIPDNIGKLATLAGIILSIVLIYTHSRKGRAEHAKLLLEIDILKQKEYERLQEVSQRKANGLKLRRDHDST